MPPLRKAATRWWQLQKTHNRMKFFNILILLTFVSCDFLSPGTLGGFDMREFNVPKETVAKSIDTFFAQNPEYKIPEDWKKYDDWSKRGYDFLDSRMFYFDTGQKEMYYVTFVSNGESNQDEKGPTILSVRAVNVGDNRWFLEKDFSEENKEIVENRFDKEIISKIEKIVGIKSTRNE